MINDKGKEVFLSIIIPVYNVGKYIEDCLKSVLDQDISKEEYEIICINDGSTDNSLEILRTYEREYSNVKAIDKENGGVCTARNAGLDVAVGKYIWFIDGDDCIRQNCLGVVQKSIMEEQPEIVFIPHENVPEGYFLGKAEEQRDNISYHADNSADSACTVWETIIKREIV